jgi:nitroimidazol reductase NimA-like FMN-containing flavoprotein (pyridoxamine 5'-phosphate oxidase superfamily)
MEYTLRRKARKIDDQAALDVLRRCDWGVLSTIGVDGLPYGVPLNYVLDARNAEKYLLFHAATQGRKLDNLRHCPQAAFVAVEGAETLPDKFSTAYASAMVSGPVAIIDDPDAKRAALRFFVETLALPFRERGDKHIEHRLHDCCVLKLTIASICGKRRERREPYALEHLGF